MLKTEEYFLLDGGIVKVFAPRVEYYIDIAKNKNLYFVKMNHAWWQLLAGRNFWKVRYEKNHDKELIDEVKNIIKNIDKTDIILAVSTIDPFQNVKKNKRKYEELEEVILKSIPDNYQPHYGSIWKRYVNNKTINKFFDHIKNHEIIVVGLNHLKELKNTLEFSNFNFFELFFDSSKNEKRIQVLEEILKIVNISGKKYVLIQAGELFSTWLIYNLRIKTTNNDCSFIDMGRSIDKFCPNRTYDGDIKKFNFIDFKQQAWMNKKI